MKNKALTYLLLIVVAVVWYQVFFRVKSNFFGGEEVPTTVNHPIAANHVLARDTFQLLANYRDPFGETKVKLPSELTENPVEVIPNIPKLVYQWPPIVYVGQVKKTRSKNPLAIINIDGIQLMVRNGEELFNDIIVKKIGRDSIYVVHFKDHKTIYRQ